MATIAAVPWRATDRVPRALRTPEAALARWLRRGGARFPKLAVDRRARGERGVRALADIAPGEPVLVVPRALLVTREVAFASDAGRALLSSGLRPGDEDVVLAAFLLQEKRRPRSFWRPYLDALPAAFPALPLFFEERELSLLEGSFLLEAIAERRRTFSEHWALVRARAPDLGDITEAELVWALSAVKTRIFGFSAGDRGGAAPLRRFTAGPARTRALVPLADMLNHDRSPDTTWSYSDAEDAFVMTAIRAVPRGAPVTDSYGRKCNGALLLNYGFTERESDCSTAVVRLGVPEDTVWADAKRRLLGLGSPSAMRSFKVALRHDDEATRQMLSFLRVACAGDREMLAVDLRRPEVDPISAANEARALCCLRAACEEALRRFPTAIEEDDEILRGVTGNARNCVVARRSEKQVLRGYIDLCDRAVPLLRAPWPALERLARSPEASWGTLEGFLRGPILAAARNDPWNTLDRARLLGHGIDGPDRRAAQRR